MGVDIEDADGSAIASRSIPVLMETGRLNAKAAEIADPLKDLHDTLDRAQTLVDTASLTLGTVTTLAPSRKATGSMTGTGWQRKLNLSIPRGSKISQLTATALDTETPTVSTSSDSNGDMIVALGLPRGKQGPQGEPGPKGDPGEVSNVPLATEIVAGVVKSGKDIQTLSDGTLSLYDRGRWYSQTGIYDNPFDIATILAYKGMGSYYSPIVTFTPNPYHGSNSVMGPLVVQVLSENYQFTSDSAHTVRFLTMMLADPANLANGLTWIGVKITPVKQTGNVSIGFFDASENPAAFNLKLEERSGSNGIYSPSFTCRFDDVRDIP